MSSAHLQERQCQPVGRAFTEFVKLISLIPAQRRVAKKARPTATAKATAPRKPSKIDKIIAMMRRPKGASISDLTKATAWQAHSVRGAISGMLRKKQGLNVVSEKSGDVRLYLIIDKAVG